MLNISNVAWMERFFFKNIKSHSFESNELSEGCPDMLTKMVYYACLGPVTGFLLKTIDFKLVK